MNAAPMPPSSPASQPPPDRLRLDFQDGAYQSPRQSGLNPRRWFPTSMFYPAFLRNVWRSSRQAKRGRYDDLAWARSSVGVLRSLERVGVRIDCRGLEHLQNLDGPCVIIGNHMSMLETMVLPGIVAPVKPVTFVVKRSLLEYPLFGHVMRSRDPIAVARHNPRDDFKAVMEQGVAKLEAGISVIVFPQTTRATTFVAAEMNTIGIKLASRAGAPVIPLALKTDAWSNGKRLKDLGPIDPSKTVYFEFGAPIPVTGRGTEAHQAVLDFISKNLARWN